jgi:ABC-2 type transport system ATP-binding protein
MIPMPPAAIRVRNLVKTYSGKPPVEAVRGLDLDVPAGECFGLLGPNGAGKTTTLEILEGLLEPTAGEVEILGMTWRAEEMAIRRRIGISLQETRLSDKLRVIETVTLFRSFYKTGLTPEAAIDRVSLGEKSRAFVDKLSGGQKQRLAVACALVGDPDLVFLDEPTTGLDPQSRRQLWDVIRSLNDRGRTVVLTTHYMDEAERLCDRVAVVDHGKVIALGTPRQLIADLGGEHVIEFTAAASIPPETVAGLKTLPGVVSVRSEGVGTAMAVQEPHTALPRLMDYLRTQSVTLAGLTTRTATLEDVFVTLTGRHLRDEGAKA